jgi:replicative DNA helicase
MTDTLENGQIITGPMFQAIRDQIGTRPDERMGIRSGLSQFDMMTRGFHNGKLYVGGARPGAGKTSFCTTVAANIMTLMHDNVLIISTEATEAEVVMQIVEAYTQGTPFFPNGRSSGDGERERLESGLFEIEQQMKYGKLRITHQKKLTASNIEQQIVEYCDGICNGNPALVMIDQASRIHRDDKERHGYAIATEHMLNTLEELADRQGVPILLMTQLNRATEFQQGASLANLKHSGAFEEYAHCVLLLEKAPGHGVLEHGSSQMCHDATIHVAKNRHGRVGPIPAHFFGECHTWREAATGAFGGAYAARTGG